jgi:uncharacterized phiE125 gp8 family phage protein
MRLEFQELEVEECISVEDAKVHMRIDTDDEDDYVESLISTARVHCENWCGTALLPQRTIVYYDDTELTEFRIKRHIRLPHLNILAVVEVNNYDDDGDDTVFSASNSYLSGDRLCFKSSAYLPTDMRAFDALSVEFISGFGTLVDDNYVEAVPKPIKQAMLELMLHWHENRAAVYDSMNTSAPLNGQMPHGVMAKLQPYKRYSI